MENLRHLMNDDDADNQNKLILSSKYNIQLGYIIQYIYLLRIVLRHLIQNANRR